MRLLLQPTTSGFVPFRLRSATEADTHWIGGDAPLGVFPTTIHSITRHLATLQLTETEAVSLFSSFDFDASEGAYSFSAGTYLLHGEESPLIQCVVHGPAKPPGSKSQCWAGYGPVGFEFGSPESEDETAPYEDHKVGGLPFVENEERGIERMMRNTLAEGFFHVIQLAFPGAQDAEINADWPFGFAVFHLFAKAEGPKIKFRYCWG